MPSPSAPRDWNAGSYHRVSAPHLEWGAEVLDRLPLRGDETVLDLGCGTGRVTRMLLERLPRGTVVAVDGSPDMARRAAAELGDRATVLCADLLALELAEPADAAISTATFHWIADHERLFTRVREALVPGGRFVAQCGGAGNIAAVAAALTRVGDEPAFRDALGGWSGPWHYATAQDTARRLEEAGFDVEGCWLRADAVTPEQPREFLQTVVLGAHLDRLPAALHDSYVDRVMTELGEPVVLDYVRLNLVARRR